MKHHQELAKPETLFINLDSVGGGELHCLTARFRSLKAEVDDEQRGRRVAHELELAARLETVDLLTFSIDRPSSRSFSDSLTTLGFAGILFSCWPV